MQQLSTKCLFCLSFLKQPVICGLCLVLGYEFSLCRKQTKEFYVKLNLYVCKNDVCWVEYIKHIIIIMIMTRF